MAASWSQDVGFPGNNAGLSSAANAVNKQQHQQQHPWAAPVRPASSSSNSSNSTAGSSRANQYHAAPPFPPPPPPPPRPSPPHAAPAAAATMQHSNIDEYCSATVLVIPWMKAAGDGAAAHITAEQAAAAVQATAAAAAELGASAAAAAAAAATCDSERAGTPSEAAALNFYGSDSSARSPACMPMMHSMPMAVQDRQQQQQQQQLFSTQPCSAPQQGVEPTAAWMPNASPPQLDHHQRQQQQQLQLLQQMTSQLAQQMTSQPGAAPHHMQVQPSTDSAAAAQGLLSPRPALQPAPMHAVVAHGTQPLAIAGFDGGSCCSSMELGSLPLQTQQQLQLQQHHSSKLNSSAGSWQTVLPGTTLAGSSAAQIRLVQAGGFAAHQLQQQQLLLQPEALSAGAGTTYASPGSSSSSSDMQHRQELLLQLQQLQQRQLQQQQPAANDNAAAATAVDAEIVRLLQLRQRMRGLTQLQAAAAPTANLSTDAFYTGVAAQSSPLQQQPVDLQCSSSNDAAQNYSSHAAVPQQYSSVAADLYAAAPQQYSSIAAASSSLSSGMVCYSPASSAAQVSMQTYTAAAAAVPPAGMAAAPVQQQGLQHAGGGVRVQTCEGWLQLLPL
uniref:Uncharacterized protein n=1 Tax=Tetradesmus obliquus TaxID=3088 RepID=A0A383VHG7_TETOB